MLYATNIFPGDNTTRQFELTFVGGYLDKSHIVAYYEDNLSKVQTTIDPGTITWLGPYTVQLPPGAQASVGTNVVFARQTPREPLVDFQGSSRITEANLDLAHRQGLFVAVESLDSSNSEVVAQLKDVIIGVQEVADEALLSAAASAASAAESASSAGVAGSQASQAMSSATAAQGQATAASGSAATALTYRNDAEGFKNTAVASASASATSEANALAYRNTASGHASAALGSANAASSSAAAALASQNAAASSASAASNSANAAATSAGNANTSAGNAAYEVTLATTQRNLATSAANAAGVFAVDAQNAATAAASSAASIAALPVWNPTLNPTNRNLLMNACGEINTRGVGIRPNGFIADRWLIEGGNSNVRGTSTFRFPVNGRKSVASLTMAPINPQPVLAPSDFMQIRQGLEAREGYLSLGYGTPSAKATVVSFWAKSTTVGKYNCSIRAPSSMPPRSCCVPFTITVAETWQFFQLPFPGDTTGTVSHWKDFGNTEAVTLTFNAASGTSYTSAATGWNSIVQVSTPGSVNLMATSGGLMSITMVQWEIGTVATPFEVRRHQDEIVQCGRYYQKAPDGSGVVIQIAPGVALGSGQFFTPMRAAPTVTPTHGSGATITVGMTTPHGFYVTSTGQTSIGWAADADMY